ncbi:hypothetical protein SLEP1_g15182 [Rubroshorea leprosula]|uniref:Uncharacterized protein n=1 Tax=Rubroshorea leprosula TaxID=152421 RepID=A0AAV5IUC6_9ROSI|nr:hypothetical protein SLEP1_g15182 [Rubroshorea leprosula]
MVKVGRWGMSLFRIQGVGIEHRRLLLRRWWIECKDTQLITLG